MILIPRHKIEATEGCNVELHPSPLGSTTKVIIKGQRQADIQRAYTKLDAVIKRLGSSTKSEIVYHGEAKVSVHRLESEFTNVVLSDCHGSSIRLFGLPQDLEDAKRKLQEMEKQKPHPGEGSQMFPRDKAEDKPVPEMTLSKPIDADTSIGFSCSISPSASGASPKGHGYTPWRALPGSAVQKVSSPDFSHMKVKPMTLKANKCNLQIHILEYDITKMKVDALITSASPTLEHRYGASKAIVQAAGTSVKYECQQMMKMKNGNPFKPGEVFISQPGELNCRLLMHAVVPFKKTQHYHDRDSVATALKECFKEANMRRTSVIAFPPLNAGERVCIKSNDP